MADWWKSAPLADQPAVGTGVGAPIFTNPREPAPQTPTAAAIEEERLNDLRYPKPTLPTGYRWKNGVVGGEAERIPGLEGEGGKPLPAWAAKPYEEQIGIYSGLSSAVKGFQDDFAGNTVTGGLENTIQGFTGLGTEGQRDWWATFRQNDNIIRNQLFGATLTPSEQQAYAATSINERMEPSEVRRNLQTRQEIVRKALARKVNFLRAQGYSEEAIEALAGEFAGDFKPREQAEQQPTNADGRPTIPMGQGEFGPQDGPPLTPEQQAAYDAFWKVNPNATADQLRAFGQSIGKPIGNAEQIIEARDKGAGVAAGSSAVSGLTPEQRAKVNERVDATNAGGSVVAGFGDSAWLGFMDEAGSAVEAVGQSLSGSGSFGDNYDARLAENRAYLDQLSERDPWWYAGGQVAGGLALPGFAARTPAELAKVGAAYGTVYGVGSGETAGERALGGAGGAVIGAATGWGGGKLLERLSGKAARKAAEAGSETAEEGAETAAQRYARGQRFGMDLSIGDVRGMGSKATERLLDVQPGSASVMNKGRDKLAEQTVRAVDNVAGTYGQTTSFTGVGEVAQKGARAWISRFEEVSGKAYQAIPISDTKPAVLSNTRQALVELDSLFKSNPRMAELMRNTRLSQYMERLGAGRGTTRAEESLLAQWEKAGSSSPVWAVRDPKGRVRFWSNHKPDADNFATQTPGKRKVERIGPKDLRADRGDLSWEDLKAFRSRIGEEIGEQRFSDSPTKSELRRLYGALSEDMKATAAQQGPQALRAFERANALYREGQQRIDDALVKILGDDGKKSPEAAAARLQAIIKDGKATGDLKLVQEVWKSLPAGERGEVANGLIRLMGQPANSSGRAFDPGAFIRNFGDMEESAKNLIFGTGDKELRANLDEFAKVIGGMAANNSTRNSSNTAMGLAGGLGLFTGGAMGLIGQAVTSYGAARLWTNPKFVRWATGYAKMVKGAEKAGNAPSSNGVGVQAKLLEKLAASEPALAQDIVPIRQAILGAVNDNAVPSAVAGSDPEGNQQDKR